MVDEDALRITILNPIDQRQKLPPMESSRLILATTEVDQRYKPNHLRHPFGSNQGGGSWLPLEFWEPMTLSNILSVEVVIKLEEETETDTDIRYAKAVVHTDIEEPLIIEIIVRHEGQDHQIHITYEVSNHEVCISCGAFGHSHQDCDG